MAPQDTKQNHLHFTHLNKESLSHTFLPVRTEDLFVQLSKRKANGGSFDRIYPKFWIKHLNPPGKWTAPWKSLRANCTDSHWVQSRNYMIFNYWISFLIWVHTNGESAQWVGAIWQLIKETLYAQMHWYIYIILQSSSNLEKQNDVAEQTKNDSKDVTYFYPHC